MKHPGRIRALTLLTISLVLISAGQVGAVTLNTVVDTNTPVPDGTGTFIAFGSVAISGSNIAIGGHGPNFQGGMYLFDGTILRRAADTNTAIPNGTGNFEGFFFVDPPVLSGSKLAFRASGPGQSGIYLCDGTTLSRVADRSTPVPNGTGYFTSVSEPALSGNDVAFAGGAGDLDGIYLFNGTTLSRVADRNTPIPNGTGNFTGFFKPVINEGKIAFRADGPGGQGGVYLFDGATLSRVMDGNTPIPDGTGNFFPGGTAIGMNGSHVTVVGFGPGNPPQQGIYLFNGATLTRVVDRNTPIPNGIGHFMNINISPPPVLSGSNVVFLGLGSGGQEGIYLFDGTTLKRVADKSTAVPDGWGNFDGFGSSVPRVRSGGYVAFRGLGAWGPGVYLFNGTTLLRVADTTTAIPNGSGYFFDFSLLALDENAVAFVGAGSGGQGVYTANTEFDYALSNSGRISVTQRASGSTTIIATLTSGSPQSVSLSASGLPNGVTATFSPAVACNPSCTTELTISTTAATPPSRFPIIVTGSPRGHTTMFNLTVSPDVAKNACRGFAACESNTGFVGDRACQGELSCAANSGDVAKNACHDSSACEFNAGFVGEAACHGDFACGENAGDVRKAGCIGDGACAFNAAPVGEAACVGVLACFGNTGVVGKRSCRGDTACGDRTGLVGEDACIGAFSCASSGSGGIGKGACHGDRACFGNPGPILKGACVGPPDPVTGKGVCEVVVEIGGWTAMGLQGIPIYSLVIDPVTPTTLYAGTAGVNGGVFKSVDGGASWSTTGLTNVFYASVLRVDPQNPATVYAGTPQGVFKSTNGGGSWSATGLSWVGSLVIDPLTPTTLYAGTDFGIFKSEDGGEVWNAVLSRPSIGALAIDPQNPGTVYAAMYGGVLKSADGGGTWSATGLTNPFVMVLAVDPVMPATVYAGTGGNGLFKSTNSGESWSPILTTTPYVQALAVDPLTLYAGTRVDGVLFSSNGGGSWSAMNTGMTTPDVLALAGDPGWPAVLYAGTSDGVFASSRAPSHWRRGPR